jgi:hypothetical protein
MCHGHLAMQVHIVFKTGDGRQACHAVSFTFLSLTALKVKTILNLTLIFLG